MNFVSNILDATPGVGHVKGGIHYVTGDAEGGNRAMYQSTRSTAVFAGGVVGSALGGPAGAVLGAIYAGSLTDVMATEVTNEPQGIVKHCKNVNDDIKQGRDPTKSLFLTGVHVACDGAGGLGMSGLSNAPVNSVGKKFASNVGEEFIEKSVKITAEEAAKFTVRKASETAVKKTLEQATIQAATATVHVAERALLETVEQDEQAKKDAARKTREQAKKDADRRKQEQAKKDADQRKQQQTKKDSYRTKSEREATTKENNEKADKDTSQSVINTGTGSGSQPPEENKNSKKTDGCNNPGQFSDIQKLLEKIIESICRKENQENFRQIFKELGRGEKNTLKTLFKQLNYFGITELVLNLVFQIFDQNFPSDFTFPNFLSLMEFVRGYINNYIEELGMIYLGADATAPIKPFKQLQTYLINLVARDYFFLRDSMDTFLKIRAEIESEIAEESLDPNFRDIFSAVYHYCKHRIVPGDGILSVTEYYGWIRIILKEIKDSVKFSDLCDSQNPRKIIYEVYVRQYLRRIRIVIKIRGNSITLSSCYVVDVRSDDKDEDGDVFIDGVWYKNMYGG